MPFLRFENPKVTPETFPRFSPILYKLHVHEACKKHFTRVIQFFPPTNFPKSLKKKSQVAMLVLGPHKRIL